MKVAIMVEMFQTFDGKTFDSEQKAKDHVTDLACEKLEKILTSESKLNLSKNDIFKIICALTEEKNLYGLKSIVNMFNYGNDED